VAAAAEAAVACPPRLARVCSPPVAAAEAAVACPPLARVCSPPVAAAEAAVACPPLASVTMVAAGTGTATDKLWRVILPAGEEEPAGTAGAMAAASAREAY
jgi:hypothetical protein